MAASAQATGVLAAGNWIVDHVKLIDAWPRQDALASIGEEHRGNGGCAYNVLKNLARLGAPFPLRAAGRIGRDEDGGWILEDCRAHGIDTTQLRQSDEAPTSYTDVMTVTGDGRRTFFHQRGANALLTGEDIVFDPPARIFLLGYLMLLDRLDAIGGDGLTGAARLLRAAREAGLKTAVDFVTVEHPEYAARARLALPHVDVLIANEVEASWISGLDLGLTDGSVDLSIAAKAARALLEAGVRQWAVIHFQQGAIAASVEGGTHWQPSVAVPPEAVAGTAGAGDGFAAGLIHGWHEGRALEDCLKAGVCVAAASLRSPTCSETIEALEKCLALGGHHGFRDPVAQGLTPWKRAFCPGKTV